MTYNSHSSALMADNKKTWTLLRLLSTLCHSLSCQLNHHHWPRSPTPFSSTSILLFYSNFLYYLKLRLPFFFFSKLSSPRSRLWPELALSIHYSLMWSLWTIPLLYNTIPKTPQQYFTQLSILLMVTSKLAFCIFFPLMLSQSLHAFRYRVSF